VYAATLSEHYSDLAHHYRRSSNTEKAIAYLQLAGQQAVQRSANAEAITLLTAALELLKTLPDTPKHTEQELALQIALGAPLIASTSYMSTEVEKVYARAWELCQQIGEPPQIFSVLLGRRQILFGQGELQAAHELGEQLLTLAQRVDDSALLLEAHRAVGATWHLLGEFTLAREHLEQVIAHYDSQQHHSHAFQYGQDPGVLSRCFAARTLWLLGYPDQALKRNDEALTLAQTLGHSYSLAWALSQAAMLHQFRREEQLTEERAEALIILSDEQGFPLWMMQGPIWRGWALAEQGKKAEGIAQIHQGLAAYRAIGGEVLRPYFLALLAEAHGSLGQAEEGLGVLAEALTIVQKSRERIYLAELYRIKGTLTLESKVESHKSKVEEAEECFLKAIAIAQRQQAKSWELRAVMSLARLWQSQGKTAEARRMLAEIYNWFTEGFDTKDLQEAKALIQELSD
jgi:predicted ATPase